MKLNELHALIAAVCSIEGINSAGVISFSASATTAQKAAAQGLMDANLAAIGTPAPNESIDAQILALEGTTERGVRESLLYMLVALAAAQGVTEPQLYAINYGYRKAKDLDNAIAALRVQRV